jgi:Tol biopolymer transport system component
LAADQANWSADGKILVFHSGSAIFSIDADGQNEREIARGLDNFNAYKYPSLSPDAQFVVFDRNNEINVTRIDGSGQRYVVQNWTTTEETPSVSPDGYNVAYAVLCSSKEQIGIVPFAGIANDPCKVTFATDGSSGRARRPAWGPDGIIAYERGDADSGVRIAITTGPGSTPCDVTAGPGQQLNPTWAPKDFAP